MELPKNFKRLVVLGDCSVGKTSLVLTYTTKTFQSEYPPYVFNDYSMASDHTVKFEDETYTLGLFDTDDGEEYDRLRPSSYRETDAFLICFKVSSRASFDNIRDKWVPEVRHFCPDVPFLIVATQIDLRDDSEVTSENQRLLTAEEGKGLTHELGGARYVECSALTQKGVDNVFDEAISVTLMRPVDQPRPRRTSSATRVKCVVI